MFVYARSGFVALLASLTLSFSSPPAYAAGDPFLGTWVLNVAKSKGPAGTVPESATLVVSELGSGRYKSVTDSVMAGIAVRTELTFAADGKTLTATMTGEGQFASSISNLTVMDKK